MSLAPRGHCSGLWTDLQGMFSEFSGISIQAFDASGNPFLPAPVLPSLCAFFQRYPETDAACRKDCYRKVTTCRDTRRILPSRCYAGLSYWVVPIRKRNRPHAVVIVGRVLTEVFGGEQCLGFIERYKLPQAAFLENLSGVRSVVGPDLDRLAGFVRRLATTSAAAETRFEHRTAGLRHRRKMLDFARQATAFYDRSPGQARGMLEFLGGALAIPGLALLLHKEDALGVEVHASIGLGEETLHELAGRDWQRVFEDHGRGSLVLPAGSTSKVRAGFDLHDRSLAAQRLEHGPHTLGYLVASGGELNTRVLEQLGSAAPFIAARLVHQKCRERAERKDEEARLLGLMAEKCLTAHSIEELLPLALEAAMCSLRAKRGSILLADEAQGRVTARAVCGVHAPISETIQDLHPGSVSHRVFFDRRSLLVRDTDQDPGLKRERQFPYATRSFVSVPLRENGHALGVLHLSEREGEGGFTPRDLSLLELLGLQASGAIRKAKLEEEVRTLRVDSFTDHLTGVYNRRYLEEHLAVECQRASRFGQSLAVAMLDLDGFKALNDEFGHDAGDRALKDVAFTIKKQLRAADMLARYGGDEFVLLLPGTGAAGALNTVEKIRARVESDPASAGGPGENSRRITVSVGISVFPDTSPEANDLLLHADEALLRAKKSGRNVALLWGD